MFVIWWIIFPNKLNPFLGDKIQRDGPIKPNSVQRDLDTSKVISADFVDSKIPSLESGIKVLHRDLGECTIVSVDKKSNQIVLKSTKVVQVFPSKEP